MDERFSLAENVGTSSINNINEHNDLNSKDYIFREYSSSELQSDQVSSRAAEGRPQKKLSVFRSKLPAAAKREEIIGK